MKRFVLLGAAILLLGGPSLHAQSPAAGLSPDDIIAVRQSLMDLQGGTAAAMKAAVDNGWEVKPMAAGAKALVASSHVIPTLFPSGTEKGHNTKAKPEVWSDHAGFQKAAATLTAAAEKLVQAADANDKAAFATAFQQVGQACGGCHRPYRNQ